MLVCDKKKIMFMLVAFMAANLGMTGVFAETEYKYPPAEEFDEPVTNLTPNNPVADNYPLPFPKQARAAAPVNNGNAGLNNQITSPVRNALPPGTPGYNPAMIPPGARSPAMPPQGAYGRPMPPPQAAYGRPMPPPQAAYGRPMPPPQTAYGRPMPPPQAAYGRPMPPPQAAYGRPMPPPQTAYGRPMPPPQAAYGRPPVPSSQGPARLGHFQPPPGGYGPGAPGPNAGRGSAGPPPGGYGPGAPGPNAGRGPAGPPPRGYGRPPNRNGGGNNMFPWGNQDWNIVDIMSDMPWVDDEGRVIPEFPFIRDDDCHPKDKNCVKDTGPTSWIFNRNMKENMAETWDDAVSAPGDMGQMPGGWYMPSVYTPNPIDSGDQLEEGIEIIPEIIRLY